MIGFIRRHLTYANVVSTVAMFVVLGAGAYAAAKITSGDIQDNTIQSKDLKDKKGVKEADLATEEDFHVVGDSGEPAFSTGVEGDCVWGDGQSGIPAINPVGFRIDRFGTVHLSGIATATDTAGAGDEECGATDPETDDSNEDSRVFTLPEKYRPANVEIRLADSTGNLLLIGGEDPEVIEETLVPAGAVFASSTTTVLLEGVDFSAASEDLFSARAAASGDAKVTKGLKELLAP